MTDEINDVNSLLNEPLFALDFQCLIGDVKDFLEFSEANIEWQLRRELKAIDLQAQSADWPDGYENHLIENAEHRFRVSLPLRVRYGALISLTTSVEWSVGFLVALLAKPLPKLPKGKNATVFHLTELASLCGMNIYHVILDYEAIVQVRNCISHSAGIESTYQHRAQLPDAIEQLNGFSIDRWHFLGRHVCIEKGALNLYIDELSSAVVEIYKRTYEAGLVQQNLTNESNGH